jgi:hypothetical protein
MICDCERQRIGKALREGNWTDADVHTLTNELGLLWTDSVTLKANLIYLNPTQMRRLMQSPVGANGNFQLFGTPDVIVMDREGLELPALLEKWTIDLKVMLDDLCEWQEHNVVMTSLVQLELLGKGPGTRIAYRLAVPAVAVCAPGRQD